MPNYVRCNPLQLRQVSNAFKYNLILTKSDGSCKVLNAAKLTALDVLFSHECRKSKNICDQNYVVVDFRCKGQIQVTGTMLFYSFTRCAMSQYVIGDESKHVSSHLCQLIPDRSGVVAATLAQGGHPLRGCHQRCRQRATSCVPKPSDKRRRKPRPACCLQLNSCRGVGSRKAGRNHSCNTNPRHIKTLQRDVQQSDL